MAQDGKLRLKIVDAQGRPVQGRAEVRFAHQVLSDRRAVTVDASKVNVITNLHAAPQGLYRIDVTLPSFETKSQFVNIAPSGFTDLEIVLHKAGEQGTAPQPPATPPPPSPPTPPPPTVPPAKALALALDRFSGLTLRELHTQNRKLYDQLQGIVAAAREAVVLSNFAGGSAELLAQLELIDYSLGDQPGRALARLIIDALTVRQATPELLKEAAARVAELERNGPLFDPAQVDLPIREHPLFQQHLQHAAVYKLADIVKLSDAKTEKLIARAGSVAAVNDEALAALVAEGALDEREAGEFGLTATLFHLTGERLALVEALARSAFASLGGGRLSQPRDLVALTADEWLAALNRAQAAPPDGQDRASYAAGLVRLIAAIFPTDALLARVGPKGAPEVAPALDRLGPLLERNPQAFGRDFDSLRLEGLSQPEIATGREAHAQLQRLVNLHPGLRLDDILNSDAPTAEKASAVGRRLGLLERVARLNPGTEFLSLDYSLGSADTANLKFDGMSQDERRMVVSDFKTYQRVAAVTKDVEGARAVIGAGYLSATNIAGVSFDSFRRDTGLETNVAREYYYGAGETLAGVAATTISIIDLLTGGFGSLFVSNFDPDVKDYLKGLDGFAELFGSQDYCQCEHCQSILSPAAYFVDLMRFVEQYVLENPAYDFTGARSAHPLNLKVRRPDLWTLPLTCENTNKLIPYLDIINEILENYVAKRRGFSGTWSDRAAVEAAVYRQALSQSAGSFRQPFFLPLERLEVYLSHFGHSRASVARAMSAPAGVRAAAALKVSRREYDLMAHANAELTFLRQLYGVEFALTGGKIAPFDAQQLLKYTGLTRDELGQLVRTRFVTGSGAQPVEVRAEKKNSDSVQNDVERVHGLTPNSLDRLHRFARLWRRVPWSVSELDLVLSQLSQAHPGGVIGDDALQRIATVLALGERWELPVEQNCALWGAIPRVPAADDRASLFDRLFNFRPFLKLDGPLPKDGVKFIHASFRRDGVPSPQDNTLPRLLAGLQLGSEQLAQLVEGLAAPLGVNLDTTPGGPGATDESARGFLLNADNLTLLYRHARLAQLLNLPVPDLFQLIGFADIGGRVSDLTGLVKLLDLHDWWKPSGFTLDDLGFITRGLVRRPGDYPDPDDLASQIVAELEADKSLQFADTVFAFVPGVTEEQSRRIIADNGARFRPAADGAAFRLADAFSTALPISVPPGVPEEAVETFILKYHASQVVPPRIAAHLGIPVEKAAALCVMAGSDLFAAPLVKALHAGDPGPLADVIADILPLAVLFRDPVFDATALSIVSARTGFFSISDIKHLTVEVARRVSAHVALAKASSAAPDDFLKAFDAVSAFFTTHEAANADKGAIARVLGADATLVATLLPNLSPLPAGVADVLPILARRVALATTLGASGETLKLIVSEEHDDLARAGEAMLSAFRTRHADEQAFLDALEPLEDKIRSRKRDALTDFILRFFHEEFDTPDALYAYLLVDVQLEGCARTSRVVSAVSSLQLYVHRCLMNLEQSRRDPADAAFLHVLPESIPADEWAWRKNYRVWEANRKVFLYPENYIEPELRDDKTPLFKELESELLQKRIDEQNVLDSYAAYLTGFEEVSRLKIAGSYHHIGEETDTLHLFGVTPGDPPTYYYRTVENAYFGEVDASLGPRRGLTYSPWRKIGVQIPVRKVSPVVYLGRLFVFWVEISTTPKNEVKGGGSKFVGYKHKLALKYTTLRLDGSWSPPQSVALEGYFFEEGEGVVMDRLRSDMTPLYAPLTSPSHWEPRDGYTLAGFKWDRVYPALADGDSLRLRMRDFAVNAKIDFYRKRILTEFGGARPRASAVDYVLCARSTELFYGVRPTSLIEDYAECVLVSSERNLDDHARTDPYRLGGFTSGLYQVQIAELEPTAEIHVINGVFADAVIDCDGDLLWLQGSVRPGPDYLLKRLGTTLGPTLARTLFAGGVDGLLDTRTQQGLGEAPLPITVLRHIEDAGNAGRLDFKGAYGTYYREIFFHIPFLIANQLNSQQRFAAAQSWYHYIFNPTASDPLGVAPDPEGSSASVLLDPSGAVITGLSPAVAAAEMAKRRRDRVWRYVEFRGLDVPRLRETLTDPAAIEAYKKDPFNPHAIARLRLSAYQKSVVMKYIDNLLDWGDSLFSQFTTESVNEATLLYVMAADILGPRPARLGDCGEGQVTPKNYETIGPLVRRGSDFLAEVETQVQGRRTSNGIPSGGKGSGGQRYVVEGSALRNLTGLSAGLFTVPAFTFSTSGAATPSRATGTTTAAPTSFSSFAISAGPAAPAAGAGARADTYGGNFYDWKSTHINSWTREQGGSRYTFANNTPQLTVLGFLPSFGWSILRQLSPVFCVPENKELTKYWDRVEDRLYKIRHCMDITGARRQLALFAPEIDPRLLVRAKAAGLSIEDVLNATSGDLPPYRFTYLIEKAKQYAAAVQGFGSALLGALEKRDAEELNRLRNVHQKNLLSVTTRLREWEIDIAADALTTLERQQAAIQYRKDYYKGLIDRGLTDWETTQQISRHVASSIRAGQAILAILSGVFHLVPQLGSPFAMKYGGQELGASARAFAIATGATADIAEAVSASAGLEAGFQRRQEGWEHQVALADHELKQIEKQLTAAGLRKEIAVRSLDIHHQTVEQLEEIFEFHNERFTGLGLYTWLSTTLQRVHREAYNSAYSMARLAEQAFLFERGGGDDNAPLLQADYWDASKAGLLAGERLLIDLQNLERRFVETNYRTLEVDQSFSLTQIDPAALINLRETGSCEFEIAEIFFDLFYPGQYRRKIKSVRLTIPCVTGPYTNVSATLTLRSSRLRGEPKAGAPFLKEVPLRHSASIAASTAQADSGVFEFSFRDERYMPFEGAGAVSDWRLSLPGSFRQFDYQTINDVIVHISYTAEEDGAFRASVEGENAQAASAIRTALTSTSLARALSLRQDFSGALNRLQHGPLDTQVRIQITDTYLPIFLRGQNITVTGAKLALKTAGVESTEGFSLAVNGRALGGFTPDAELGELFTIDLFNSSNDFAGAFPHGIIGEHTLAVTSAGTLAPQDPQPGDPSALDSAKLLDVILYFEYRVATSP